MCEQCATDSLIWSQVLTGWSLMWAQKDGRHMSKRQFGLVRLNDPDVIWSGPPQIEPCEDEDNQWSKWAIEAREFGAALELPPEIGWALTEACRQAGFKPSEHGILHYWLWDHLAKEMKRRWPTNNEGVEVQF